MSTFLYISISAKIGAGPILESGGWCKKGAWWWWWVCRFLVVYFTKGLAGHPRGGGSRTSSTRWTERRWWGTATSRSGRSSRTSRLSWDAPISPQPPPDRVVAGRWGSTPCWGHSYSSLFWSRRPHSHCWWAWQCPGHSPRTRSADAIADGCGCDSCHARNHCY